MKYDNFIETLSEHLRTSEDGAKKLIATAPFTYKHYKIPKRSGGERDIYHPSPALKLAQRWVFQSLLKDLPIHASAQSYIEHKSITTNAKEHVKSNYFTRIDFVNFFPSISSGNIKSYFERFGSNFFQCDEETLRSIIRLCCRAGDSGRELALSIGAPSSPFISNAVMYEFDEAVSEACRNLSCIYTRYADDIYISSKERSMLNKAEEKIRRDIIPLYKFLQINEKKVQRLSRKRRVIITGVNISSSREISVGRENYRKIKTRFFLALTGNLGKEETSSLRGLISHSISIDPTIKDRLIHKFGLSEYQKFMQFPDSTEK